MTTKKCSNCGKELEGFVYPWQIHCSDRCRVKAYVKRKKAKKKGAK